MSAPLPCVARGRFERHEVVRAESLQDLVERRLYRAWRRGLDELTTRDLREIPDLLAESVSSPWHDALIPEAKTEPPGRPRQGTHSEYENGHVLSLVPHYRPQIEYRT